MIRFRASTKSISDTDDIFNNKQGALINVLPEQTRLETARLVKALVNEEWLTRD